MKINRKIRFQLFVQNWLFLVLFLALVGMLGYLTHRFHVERDVTQAARSLLTESMNSSAERGLSPRKVLRFG